MYKIKVPLIIPAVLLLFQACSQEQSTKDSSIPTKLEEAFKIARSTNNLRSLLVCQSDSLIAEEYFAAFPSDSLEHVRSVTKSVMTTLIGIAVDQGIIESIDDPITKYLGKTAEGKESITIKHLMTMTSGLAWNEVIGNMEIDTWINSENPVKYVLNKPFENTPGVSFEYSTGIIHLLSAILTEASGMSTLEFGNKFLFEPLDIDRVEWQLLNDGYFHGGSRLQLKPRDMVKFGQLFANDGIYKGKRVISSSFVKEATKLHANDAVAEDGKGYGYGWWTGTDSGLRIFFAQGYGGQTVVVVPEHELVIVTTYKWKVSNQMAADQQMEALNKVIGSVLKSMLM